MDNPTLLETTELKFLSVIEEAHKDGLSYWQILKILQCYTIPQLMMKSQAEQLLT